MEGVFFSNQSVDNKKVYIDLIDITGSLSNLFSESKNPFLYYRAMENIFCKAFDANNLSRSDVSADACKNGLGIGLKTFLHGNGRTFQKIAEFNKISTDIKKLSEEEMIRQIAIMRNKRIKSTMNICELKDMIYHMITRSEGYMAIYEERMSYIDLDNIKITNRSNTAIHFTDNNHHYNFNLSKSTLFKRFNTDDSNKILGFDVNIMQDPFDFLLYAKKNILVGEKLLGISDNETVLDYIVLPMYSDRDNEVHKKSGLNQWNAGGRKRHNDELYIVVPSWIHKFKKGFFDYNTDDFKTAPFDVILPSGKNISMKIAQQGGKSLMSNPNSALGKWILRDVLELKPKEIVTRKMLDIIGIDSIKLSKMKDGTLHLDFLKTGSYKEFKQEYLKGD